MSRPTTAAKNRRSGRRGTGPSSGRGHSQQAVARAEI